MVAVARVAASETSSPPRTHARTQRFSIQSCLSFSRFRCHTLSFKVGRKKANEIEKNQAYTSNIKVQFPLRKKKKKMKICCEEWRRASVSWEFCCERWFGYNNNKKRSKNGNRKSKICYEYGISINRKKCMYNICAVEHLQTMLIELHRPKVILSVFRLALDVSTLFNCSQSFHGHFSRYMHLLSCNVYTVT